MRWTIFHRVVDELSTSPISSGNNKHASVEFKQQAYTRTSHPIVLYFIVLYCFTSVNRLQIFGPPK